MEITEVLSDMNKIWRNELDENDIVLALHTTAKDIEGWDSLTNIQLIVATERKYKIRFTASEIMNFSNIGDMAEAIVRKTSHA